MSFPRKMPGWRQSYIKKCRKKIASKKIASQENCFQARRLLAMAQSHHHAQFPWPWGTEDQVGAPKAGGEQFKPVDQFFLLPSPVFLWCLLTACMWESKTEAQLSVAAGFGDLATVHQILQQPEGTVNVNWGDPEWNGEMALHSAAYYFNLAIVQALYASLIVEVWHKYLSLVLLDKAH